MRAGTIEWFGACVINIGLVRVIDWSIFLLTLFQRQEQNTSYNFQKNNSMLSDARYSKEERNFKHFFLFCKKKHNKAGKQYQEIYDVLTRKRI